MKGKTFEGIESERYVLVTEKQIREAMKIHRSSAPVLMIEDPDDPSVAYFNVLVSQSSYV